MSWRIVLDPTGPCLCENRAKLRDCCLSSGVLYKPVETVIPPGKVTGYGHADCYLRSTKNCSQKISREHYVSEAIFEEFDGLEVSGAPWLAPGERRRIGIGSATANILCTRHNSALSPLDTEAARFFRTLRNVGADIVRKTLSRRNQAHIFSGATLELWTLKVACGAFFAKSPSRDFMMHYRVF
jgi:hypothetical protein